MTAFKKNLRRLRKEQGLSQRALAQKLGVTQRLVAYYETTAPNIPLSKVQDVAEVFNVSIAEMLDARPPKYADLTDLDVRTIRKIRQIDALPRRSKEALWHTINNELEMHALKTSRKTRKSSSSG